MHEPDDLIVPALIAAVGAIPLVGTVAGGESFGAAATLGLGAVILGVVSLASECFRAHLPPARTVSSGAVGCPQRDRPEAP